jgi:hypothetical protein
MDVYKEYRDYDGRTVRAYRQCVTELKQCCEPLLREWIRKLPQGDLEKAKTSVELFERNELRKLFSVSELGIDIHCILLPGDALCSPPPTYKVVAQGIPEGENIELHFRLGPDNMPAVTEKEFYTFDLDNPEILPGVGLLRRNTYFVILSALENSVTCFYRKTFRAISEYSITWCQRKFTVNIHKTESHKFCDKRLFYVPGILIMKKLAGLLAGLDKFT